MNRISIGLLMILSLSNATGQKFALDKPIHIEADRVELDEKKGVSTYHGKVKIKQAEVQILADDLIVNVTKNKIQRLSASGNPVTMQRSGISAMRAEAKRMEYYADEGRVVIIGNAHLWQGVNEFSGDRIEYHLQNNRITASKNGNSKQRVHVILRPQPKKKSKQP